MSEFIRHPIKTPSQKLGIKKTPMLIIGLVGAGAAVYVIEKRRNAVDASAVSSDVTDATQSDATDANGGITDWSSDNGYGDYSPVLGGYAGYSDPSTGAVITGAGAQTVLAPTSNAQWAQMAVAQLTNTGYDGTTVIAALGKYLAGGTLTQAQAEIVQAAIATEGYPPSNPPPVHVVATPSKDTTAPAAPAGIHVGKGPSPTTKVINYLFPAHATGVQLLSVNRHWLMTEQYTVAGQEHHFLVPAHGKFYLRSVNGQVSGGTSGVITT